MNEYKILINTALEKNNLYFPEEKKEKMALFLELLARWNKIFNLTAIRNPKESVYLHLIDSLTLLPFLYGNKIIDIGSGAGLPGIPLALAMPEKTFFLLDSNSKKTRFIQQAIGELGLKNVTVVHSRAENFCPSQKFDSILTRAFSSLKTMLTVTHHLAATNSYFLAMKGALPTEEMHTLPDGFIIKAVHSLQIAGISAQRHLISIQKTT